MKLSEQNCVDYKPGTPALAAAEAAKLLAEIPGWEIVDSGKALQREFKFSSYLAGADFVASVAGMSQAENHHPDIQLAYKKVKVLYSTHSAGGLTLNDFICAAKASAFSGVNP